MDQQAKLITLYRGLLSAQNEKNTLYVGRCCELEQQLMGEASALSKTCEQSNKGLQQAEGSVSLRRL